MAKGKRFYAFVQNGFFFLDTEKAVVEYGGRIDKVSYRPNMSDSGLIHCFCGENKAVLKTMAECMAYASGVKQGKTSWSISS